jgi:hypothetical protein
LYLQSREYDAVIALECAVSELEGDLTFARTYPDLLELACKACGRACRDVEAREEISLLPALVAPVFQFQALHPGAGAFIKSGDAAGTGKGQHVVGAAHQALSQ